MNHKVYVLIEDSAYNYHIDILKLPKSVSLDYSNGLLANDNKKKKKYTSTLLNEIELGGMFIPIATHSQVNWGSRSETAPYLQESFIGNGA